MLKLLTVRNFAMIEAIAVEFKYGLNLLTGETGSGKSVARMIAGDHEAKTTIETAR